MDPIRQLFSVSNENTANSVPRSQKVQPPTNRTWPRVYLRERCFLPKSRGFTDRTEGLPGLWSCRLTAVSQGNSFGLVQRTPSGPPETQVILPFSQVSKHFQAKAPYALYT